MGAYSHERSMVEEPRGNCPLQWNGKSESMFTLPSLRPSLPAAIVGLILELLNMVECWINFVVVHH